jgi:CheY-like chemotaxis protein
MPEGGRVAFTTRLVAVERDELARSIDVAPGRYVVTTVVDSGTGIPEEVRSRLFEPFFTTKPPGKGTGMGLAVAYGIAKNHGGSIVVDSEPGHGATFSIYLPVAEARSVAKELAAEEPTPGKGRILVVDDEGIVRETVRAILETLGYEVRTASDGDDALALYREQAETIDLVILDLSMPAMDGRDCLRALLELDASARVLVSTGHAIDGGGDDLLAAGALGLLQKPYIAQELGDAVAAALK